jgi:hypothetical protein
VCQGLSGVYFLAIAQSVFANRLLQEIDATIPRLNPVTVLGTGASDIHKVFSGADLVAVVDAYMAGIKLVFAFALAASACSVILALTVPAVRLPDHSTNDKHSSENDEAV